MTKKKPNYTKFMRKPAVLQLNPPEKDELDIPDRSNEENIPFAEIILPKKARESIPVETTVSPPLSAQPDPEVGVNRPVFVNDQEDLQAQEFQHEPISGIPPVPVAPAIIILIIAALLM